MKKIIVVSLFDIFSPIINSVFYITKTGKKIRAAKWK